MIFQKKDTTTFSGFYKILDIHDNESNILVKMYKLDSIISYANTMQTAIFTKNDT